MVVILGFVNCNGLGQMGKKLGIKNTLKNCFISFSGFQF